MSEEQVADSVDRNDVLHMAVDIVAAYVSRNQVATTQLPEIMRTVFQSLDGLGGGADGGAEQKPAVPIRRSVTDEYLICLEDGRKLKMLKRHLRTAYGMSPEDYRAKWNLPADYPMVAPNYAERRSQFAKEIGLGRQPGSGRRKGAKGKVK